MMYFSSKKCSKSARVIQQSCLKSYIMASSEDMRFGSLALDNKIILEQHTEDRFSTTSIIYFETYIRAMALLQSFQKLKSDPTFFHVLQKWSRAQSIV
uniref:Uncharacterized protein n=1 Tax=Romanomermis culicivorax TaxID=13658 RepID=A0A915K8L9_ROMCU